MAPRSPRRMLAALCACSAALTILAGTTHALEARDAPIVAAFVTVPADLRPEFDAYATDLSAALALELATQPNIVFDGSVKTTEGPSLEADTPQIVSESPADFVIYAQILRQSEGEAPGIADVAVRLYQPDARADMHVQRFRAAGRELSQYARIVVQSLIVRVVGSALGTIRVRADRVPSAALVAVVDDGSDGRALPLGVLRVSDRASGAVVLTSPPLLPGDYAVTFWFDTDSERRQVVHVSAGSAAEMSVVGPVPSSGNSEPLPISMPGTADLVLAHVEPGQWVSVRHTQDELPLDALLHLPPKGGILAQRLTGVRRDQVGQTDTRSQEFVLRNLPDGQYQVATWRSESPAPGKAQFVGFAKASTLELRAPSVRADLELSPSSAGSSRLVVVWSPFGPPDGIKLLLDGRLVGEVFSCAEAHVTGLPTGTYRITLRADGFDDGQHTCELRERLETTVFIRLSPATGSQP
ncbi:hypothetical protein FJZ36_07005 [Candidatus Poribacteria bacterium]|nr:hypothetical protein [Candidatus Poribacteria bacterium]